MILHEFGSDWTELKLQIINSYLKFYVTALKNMPFQLIYIDAFSGSGERHEKIPGSSLLNQEEVIVKYDGSVIKALDIEPKFSAYHFIEKHKKRFSRLQEITSTYTDHNIHCYNQDANKTIIDLCKSIDWKRNRAVMFLDPYGLSIDYETLRIIQKTEAIDVWYLFSTSGFYRNVPIQYDKLEENQRKRITKILGSDSWIEDLFFSNKTASEVQVDLFDNPVQTAVRETNIEMFENYVQERLKNIFPLVSQAFPLPLTGAQMYSLFFAISNPSPKANALAKKVTDHILKTQMKP
ncbi:MAG: three-Cys-motif partner protein TcmP [Methylococcaceae bacterium]